MIKSRSSIITCVDDPKKTDLSDKRRKEGSTEKEDGDLRKGVKGRKVLHKLCKETREYTTMYRQRHKRHIIGLINTYRNKKRFSTFEEFQSSTRNYIDEMDHISTNYKQLHLFRLGVYIIH